MTLLGSIGRAVSSLVRKKQDSGFGAEKKSGGVDAGRDAFVRLKDREYRQTRSLLRKINLYRTQQKASKKTSFIEKKSGSGIRKILLALCFGAALCLFFSADGMGNVRLLLEKLDYFQISGVEVRGCVKSSAEKIRADSGILISSSLFSLADGLVEERVKSENPWVRTVRLVRDWPDKVILDIGEYVPVALTVVDGGAGSTLYYMDGEGAPFIETTAGMDLDYPVVSGVAQQTGSDRSEQLQEALSFLSLLQKNNPNLPSQSVSEINVDSEKGLVVHMVEYPFPIFFGKGDVKKKYYRLRRVLEKLYRYKPSKNNMGITDVMYIKMDYTSDKVLVGYSRNLESG